jgi:hypothetical protein
MYLFCALANIGIKKRYHCDEIYTILDLQFWRFWVVEASLNQGFSNLSIAFLF